MATGHPLLARLEDHVSRYRDALARLTPEVAHLREEREIVMNYLSDFGTALKTLIADRQAADDKAAFEGQRADAAEKSLADLQAQVAADEATLKGMLGDVEAENAKEAPAISAPSAPSPDATVTTSPSGATVTVDPAAGTTTHVDPATGTTTTVPHDGSTPTAVDSSVIPAQPVEPAPAAVAEAVAASADAGVTVPAADPAIPTTVG